jgi:DNA-binding LytR/AlgR family response regulator
MTITAVIAEDEPLLRADLKRALNKLWPELKILAEEEDGAAALEAIATHHPMFAFLDIRMPGLTGLDVAAGLRELSPKTQVVFVTAYQQYAIDAFERGAIDYILKPIDDARLSATINRLKLRMDKGVSGNDLAAVMEKIAARMKADAPAHEPLTWITASAGKDTRLIMIDDVLYFQADNKYTVVMTAEGESLIKTPIKELLEKLDGATWKQVHRATIVNLRAIKAVSRDDTGKGLIKFKNSSATAQISQPFMHLFRNM